MKTQFIAITMFLACAAASPAAEVTNIAAPTAAKWIAATPTTQILDVRTKEEFASGHLPKAILIPWTDKDFTERAAKELDPRKPLLVYCRSGRRSAEASAALVKLGFTDVRNVEGGILAWKSAKQPIIKTE